MSSVFAHILKINGTVVTRANLRNLADRLARTQDKALTNKVRKAIKAMDQNGVRSARIQFDPKLIDKSIMPDSVTLSELEGLYGIEVHPADLGEAKSGNTFFAEVSRRILEKIKAGTLPWRQAWSKNKAWQDTQVAGPRNYISNKPYRGVNYLNCLFFGGGEATFITAKQAEERGGKIVDRKAGVPICYFVKTVTTEFVKTKDKGGEEQLVEIKNVLAGLKWYTVYPLSATEGVKPIERTKESPVKASGFTPVQAAEKIVSAYRFGPKIGHGGDRAVYSPSSDMVRMPPKSAFKSTPEYYCTLFHELIHSTGHPNRLDRLKVTTFGTKIYAAEELVAELGASFLCAICKLDYYTLDNSAAYLKNWAGALVEEISKDKQFFVKQQFASLKAVRYMMGSLWKTWNKTGQLGPMEGEPASRVKKKGALSGVKNLPEHAKKAIEHYEQSIAGRSIYNQHKGVKIFLPRKAAEHVFMKNDWSEENAAVVTNIDSILSTALFVKTEKPRKKVKPNVIGFHVFAGCIHHKGKWIDVKIVVRIVKVSKLERYYYDSYTIKKSNLTNRSGFDRNGTPPVDLSGCTTNVQNPGQKSNRMRIVKAEDLADIKIETLKLQGVWKDWLGEPAVNFDLLLSGAPGGGKSTLLLQFAHYLANNLKKRVLFVSKEEFGSATLAEKVQRLKIKGVHFTNTLTPDAKLQGDYDVVFVDSITDLRMSVDDYKYLRELNPDVAFLLIAQQTKGGLFKGSNEWPHETEIVAEVADGKAWCTKNRYSMNKEPIQIPGYVQ